MNRVDTMQTREEHADQLEAMDPDELTEIQRVARSKKRDPGTMPENILLKPLALPRMINIKNGETPEDEVELG